MFGLGVVNWCGVPPREGETTAVSPQQKQVPDSRSNAQRRRQPRATISTTRRFFDESDGRAPASAAVVWGRALAGIVDVVDFVEIVARTSPAL